MSKYVGLEEKRILVVEDVELNQYLARHIMESWGCIVEIVENGRLAVEKVEGFDFDLVLMDIQMPVMDGMEATKCIREMQDEKKSSVPIVALTANALKADCEIYISLGMNDWLAKPFAEPALYKTVSKNIRKERSIKNSPVQIENTDEEEVNVVAEKIYDLTMVESISGGDKSFIERMMRLFLETVPHTLSDMSSTADKGDWKMLSKHAHKLKSTIDSMGIKFLKEDIRVIESVGKMGGNPEPLPALVVTVVSHMRRVMEHVKRDHGI
jgi:CheY-like chemotaxis protein